MSRAVRDEIVAHLLRTPSAGLRFCAGPANLADRLAAIIELAIRHGGAGSSSLAEMARLAATDYRLIALHLHRRTVGANQGRMRAERQCRGARRIEQVASLDHIETGDSVNVLVFDERYRVEINDFMAACEGAPGATVERFFDLPSRNAVYRDGVVKRWRLPGGTGVVSKRDNRRKPRGVVSELKNLDVILHRLSCPDGGTVPLSNAAGGGEIGVDRPLVAFWDPGTQRSYALWLDRPGISLEDLLLGGGITTAQRTHLLSQCRRCLDAFFDRGIVWRDMSPRNLLVNASAEGGWLLHLVDFEKVDVLDGPLSPGEREAACRTQFCVEEFGVVCSEAELLATFAGLFHPQNWDLDSDAPLPNAPRAELAAVLAGRAVSQPVSIGAFNRLDQAVYQVRRPHSRQDGRTIYPGLLGFRAEHYLSLSADIDCADYDRKLTEVLLAANATGHLFAVFDVLWSRLAALEVAVLVSEFEAILSGGSCLGFVYPADEARALCDTIDGLMRCTEPGRSDIVLQFDPGIVCHERA
jgi:hypothetical protein